LRWKQSGFEIPSEHGKHQLGQVAMVSSRETGRAQDKIRWYKLRRGQMCTSGNMMGNTTRLQTRSKYPYLGCLGLDQIGMSLTF